MLFHGKALEVYTSAYQNIQKIDEEEDLEVGSVCVCVCVSVCLSVCLSVFLGLHRSIWTIPG